MLQHDYLLEIIGQFVQTVTRALLQVFRDRDFSAISEIEHSVAELLDLDEETAMSLSPQSLVTMMTLSGVGESVASYAAYALDKVADAYELEGDDAKAEIRREQAAAIASAFNAGDEVPEEFADLDAAIRERRAR